MEKNKKDLRKRNYKKVYKNNNLFIKVLRNTIYFIVGTLYFTKNLIIEMIKALIRFLIGLFYIVLAILRSINKINARLFKRLPMSLRTAFIYLLIIVASFNAYNIKIINTLSEEKNILIEKLEKAESPVQINFLPKEEAIEQLTNFEDEQQEKNNKVCQNAIACKIYNKAIEKGATHEQALIITSISRHETGNWTSKAFNNKNNFGGVMCNSGLKTYNSFDEGLEGFTNLLINNYFNKGLTTIELIGNKYCPVGASNDPNGLNKNWIPRVTQYYNEYK